MRTLEPLKSIDEKRLTLIRFLSKLKHGRDGEPLDPEEKDYVMANIEKLEVDIAELEGAKV